MIHVYMDLDAVAYSGACSAEKKAYQFVNNTTGEKTQEFDKAAKAKEYMEEEMAFGFKDPEEWERITLEKTEPYEKAVKGVEWELGRWIKTAKDKLGKDTKIHGYLTCSGIKDKDLDFLEKRYQHNRYDDKVNWVAKPKPLYLSRIRSYLISTYDWIKMSPTNKEADACVVYFAEKKGLNGCAMSKDKDIRQVMGCHYIEMNGSPKDWKKETFDILGDIRLKENAKKIKSMEGEGFKLICAQTVGGDTSDGYSGLKGFGPVAVYDLLKEAETPEECCEKLVNLYNEKYPEPYTYKDWNDKEQTKTSMEMLDMHMRLAYHERGPKDKLTPITRYLKGSSPIYK